MFQRHPVQNEFRMFITTNTKDRKPIFKNDAFAREAIDTLYRVQQLHPFFLYSFVIMPDHCHFLLQIPAPEKISTVMRVFKYGLSENLGIGPIWQSRFDLRIVNDSVKVLEYIHWNPVKAGFVEKPEDYQWSSASGLWDVTHLEL